VSEDFSCGEAHAVGQVIGLSEDASGTLMNGGAGLFLKDVGFHACDGEALEEIRLHIQSLDGLQVTFGDNLRRKGEGGLVHELVDRIAPYGKDYGEPGIRIPFEEGDGVKFGKYLEPHE
jgi:hypothetical protein